MRGVGRHLPALLPMARAWLQRTSTHWAQAAGGGRAQQAEGLDQGCPLAPLCFSLATRDAVEALEAAVVAADPGGAVLGILG